jgi:hypothetical protein
MPLPGRYNQIPTDIGAGLTSRLGRDRPSGLPPPGGLSSPRLGQLPLVPGWAGSLQSLLGCSMAALPASPLSIFFSSHLGRSMSSHPASSPPGWHLPPRSAHPASSSRAGAHCLLVHVHRPVSPHPAKIHQDRTARPALAPSQHQGSP